jgi:hypothetical protein
MIRSFRKQDPVVDIPEISIGSDHANQWTAGSAVSRKPLRETRDSYLPHPSNFDHEKGVKVPEVEPDHAVSSAPRTAVARISNDEHVLPVDPFSFIEAEPVVDEDSVNMESHAMSPTLRTALLSFSSSADKS